VNVNTAVAALGSWMPHQKSIDERLDELEAFQKEAKPIMDAYKAGQLIWRLVWVLGAVFVGIGGILKSWAWITSNIGK
jgi:hypothetical protein